MKTLPLNKTTKELGYKIGDKFVVEDDSDRTCLRKGMIVTLVEEDETITPYFSSDSFKREPIFLSRLSPFTNSLETLEEGDIILNYRGSERKVLAVVGGTGETRCYVISSADIKSSNGVYTAYELGRDNFTLKKECCDGTKCCKEK